MNTAKVAAIIVSSSIGLFSAGCASDMGSHETGAGSASLLAKDDTSGGKTAPLPTKDDGTGGRGGNGGDPDLCLDTALPELVELVNSMLGADQSAGPVLADASDASGPALKVINGTAQDESNVKAVRDRYISETGETEAMFVDQLLMFQGRLVNTAVPAITSTTCGTEYPYFAVPFNTPGEAAKLDWFFRRSQHKFMPPQPCGAQFASANGVPRDSICAFADPTWSSKGNNPSLSTQRYTGVAGNAWIPTATVAVSANPTTAIDAATGLTTVTFTAYRAAGDPGTFTLADTSAVRLTYSGTDMGVWQADVTSVPGGTGSKGILRVQYKIAP